MQNQYIDPVCLSPRLLDIIVAHRLPVHVVSFTHAIHPSTAIRFPSVPLCGSYIFQGTHCIEFLVAQYTSSSRFDLVTVACKSSPCFLVWTIVYTFWFPFLLSCYDTLAGRVLWFVFFLPHYPTRLFHRRCFYRFPSMPVRYYRHSFLLFLLLCLRYEFAAEKYTRFKPLVLFPTFLGIISGATSSSESGQIRTKGFSPRMIARRWGI